MKNQSQQDIMQTSCRAHSSFITKHMRNSRRLRKIARLLLCIFFIVAGIGHFIMPDFYIKMMPPYLPIPYTLIYLSGLAEIGLGLIGLFPSASYWARAGMIWLLMAVFPANLHMALNPQLFPEFSPYGLLIRLPFQVFFILWVIFSFPSAKSDFTSKPT